MREQISLDAGRQRRKGQGAEQAVGFFGAKRVFAFHPPIQLWVDIIYIC